MDSWLFEITDESTGSTITQVIDSPRGWDEAVIKIKRHPDYHGIFFDYTFDSLEFTGDAADIIEAAYAAMGIEAITTLSVTWTCDTEVLLYTGKLNYHKYKKVCAYERGCWVEIPLESIGPLMKLRNRIDQKVNLDTTEDFAGNAVTPYTWLGKRMTLPCKAIEKHDDHRIGDQFDDAAPLTITRMIHVSSSGSNFTRHISLPFGFSGKGYTVYNEHKSDPYNEDSAPIFTPVDFLDYTPPTLCPENITISEAGDYTFEIRVFAEFTDQTLPHALSNISFSLCSYINGTITPLITVTKAGPTTTTLVQGDFNLTHNVTLAAGDTIGYGFQFYAEHSSTLSDDYHLKLDWPLSDDAIVYFRPYLKFKSLSTVPDSTAKVYMVNEALSRTVEAITDGDMLAISDYFGRVDSEPYYTASSDGCGSQEVLTNGLLIRNARIADKYEPLMNVSLKELFEGLKAIHCIGMGMEEDTDRPYYYGVPYQRMRFEPFNYFYQENILMYCLNVNTLEVETREDGYISTVKAGYAKYEAESTNGIDEFLSQREYRSTLSQSNKTLDILCKFIASGYAIEVTRRKNYGTKDWRFDNDIFIICMERTVSGTKVEQGNIDFPANIIDPDTVYNFRISPLRNMLRWMRIIMAHYLPSSTAAKFVFSSGTGNYYAEGVVTGGCVIERDFAANSESGEINYETLPAPNYGTPIWKNERVKFSYPMTAFEHNEIRANPYGKIAYSFADGEIQYGWIESIEYKAAKGIADFILIPKRPEES